MSRLERCRVADAQSGLLRAIASATGDEIENVSQYDWQAYAVAEPRRRLRRRRTPKRKPTHLQTIAFLH